MATIINSELTNYGRRIYSVEHNGYTLNVYDPHDLEDLDRRANILHKLAVQDEAQERITNGEDPSSLVHEIWFDPESYYGLSSSITVEDYQRGGYTSRYYSLAELANM